ncbi:hypothetical protein MASR2M15_04220 [Anaerolineales bacterium]
MRYLHTIAPHERFVGSGVYEFSVQGLKVPLIEKWIVHELKGGAKLYRMEREDHFHRSQQVVLAEALFDPVDQLDRFNWYWLAGQGQDGFKADYSLLDNYIQLAWTVGQFERRYMEVEYQRDTLFMPDFALFFRFLKEGQFRVFRPVKHLDQPYVIENWEIRQTMELWEVRVEDGQRHYQIKRNNLGLALAYDELHNETQLSAKLIDLAY